MTATAALDDAPPDASPDTPTDAETGPAVDPRAPRFGQSLTASLLVAGVALGVDALVFAVAIVLGTAVLTRWRVDLWGTLFRRLAMPRLAPPTHLDDPSPHRFAKLMGAVGTAVASGLLLAGFTLPAYAIALTVASAAALAAVTGLCIGCRLYRQVQFVQRLGIV